jgi:single-strand DNA-binding protein
MSGLNDCKILGNLGRDPEFRETPGGTGLATGSLAVKDRYKDKEGEWHDVTTWVNYKIWGARAAAFCKHHKKGDAALIQGKYAIDSYEKDGERKSFSYINVQDWYFLPNPNRSGNQGGGQAPQFGSQTPAAPAQGNLPDDVPF